MKLIVALHNIRSTYNVGAILRSAEGFGVEQIILSGYTPRYNDKKLLPHLREKLNHQIAKTSLGAEELLAISFSDDILATLENLKQQGWKILGLENNIQDSRLYNLADSNLKKCLGDRVILVLGEEVAGIDHALYPLIDYFAEIPMHGKKESFNVSVAAGIALYELKK